jgi:hypothetical protein
MRCAIALGLVLVSGCAAVPAAPTGTPATVSPDGTRASSEPWVWPAVPPTSDPALAPDVEAAIDRLVADFGPGRLDRDALAVVADSGDARLAWLIGDLLRFAPPGDGEAALLEAFETLTGTDPVADDRFGMVPWVATANVLIGWDLPAPPGYREAKATVYLAVEPAWEPFFADPEATIDWRWISWGGVLIDDRPVGDGGPCRGGCIPALDDPALTDAAGGDWYAHWRPVFGVAIDGEAVAFPRHIMEVHEMVNLTVGGRRIGLPYCTLCASAQAYLTDAVPGADGPLVLRTSGLLSRSNKVMYDLGTRSAFNTFTGRATSGPLLDSEVVLEQVPVVATSWGEWKAAHPATRIVARDGGIGRSYPDDPLEGRDEAGPIFPIGQVDPRLRPQHRVVGAVGPDGPVAFPVDEALGALEAGERVRVGAVEAVIGDGGLRIRRVDGDELAAHPAFWFAWSQFHPGTALWAPPGT